MKTRILQVNEEAFLSRYGISLNTRWEKIDEEVRDKALEEAGTFDKNGIEKSVDFTEDNILRVVIGFGGRSCLRKLLEKSIPTMKAIMWEPDEAVFEAYCTQTDISDMIYANSLYLVIGNKDSEVENVLKDNLYESNAFHNKVFAIGKYVTKDNPYVKTLVKILERISSEAVKGGNSRKKFRNLPCKNLLYTIHSLSDNYVVSQLFESIPVRDIPVIIVAAGPSLMKNYKELKRVKNKAIVVAVTHAMKTLNKGGIEPDLVAITDAVATDFMDFDKKKEKILLSSAWADRECREGYDGHIIYHSFNTAGHLYSDERTMTEPFAEMNTGSVATDVFSLFVEAGFERIILVGQDLACDEKGHTHTNGQTEKSYYEKPSEYTEITDIYGNPVRTRWDWQMFKEFLERKISSNSNVHVIDATEGGALIKGTEVLSLATAIDRYCNKEYPLIDWINTMERGNDEEREYVKQWFEESIFNLKKIHEYLKEIVELNESIKLKWVKPETWDNGFSSSCKRYDILYDQIMNGTRGDLLATYCEEPLQHYIENALVMEGDENALRRMEMEHDLFLLMISKAEELLTYIKSLVADNE